ncbi:lamin tail domain-containing protein [Pyxidicoccus sp. 3LG]
MSQVRVEASTNGGTQWDVLAASVPAVNGSYAWTLPDIDSSTVLVRVVDASNPERSDTSDAALTLVTGTARVIINEFLADEPAINGNPNPAYEFVEIVNTSPFSVDISGWSIWDSTNGAARHVFPSGIRLGAGKGYVVFGGAAAVPAGRTNAAAATGGTLGLGNSNDTVRLRLPNGTVVDQFAYTSAHVKDNVSANRSPDGDPAGTFVLHDTLPSGTASSPGARADGSEF